MIVPFRTNANSIFVSINILHILFLHLHVINNHDSLRKLYAYSLYNSNFFSVTYYNFNFTILNRDDFLETKILLFAPLRRIAGLRQINHFDIKITLIYKYYFDLICLVDFYNPFSKIVI